MKRTIRVGIVQQACTNDLKLNLEKPAPQYCLRGTSRCAVSSSSRTHNTPYFCQTEDTNLFDLAEPIPRVLPPVSTVR